ncbi:hypothetical protein GGI42DRAFT_334380 [Trichoderma sp. SZMC 28013]
MKADHPLKAILDGGETDEVLVSCIDTPGNLKTMIVQNWANIDELDPALTVIACMYKLIMANLLRFMEPTEGFENECIWDIHHEDWQRAHAIIIFTKRRRANFKSCPRAGSPKYKRFQPYEPEFCAYAPPGPSSIPWPQGKGM